MPHDLRRSKRLADPRSPAVNMGTTITLATSAKKILPVRGARKKENPTSHLPFSRLRQIKWLNYTKTKENNTKKKMALRKFGQKSHRIGLFVIMTLVGVSCTLVWFSCAPATEVINSIVINIDIAFIIFHHRFQHHYRHRSYRYHDQP